MKSTIEDKPNCFEGQDFYISLDVHKKNYKVTIRNNGRELKTYSMESKPEVLSNYMTRNYPGGTYHSVYEAGFSGYSIHRELSERGFKNIVINPADVPTKQKEAANKNDKIDSRKLARELEHKSLEGIYIPGLEEEALRNISRLRFQIVKESTRIKNRIKSFLDLHGISLPEEIETKHWSKVFIKGIKELKFKENYNKLYLDNLIDELEHQRQRNLEILREIREISNEKEEIGFIRTVPGIGPIVSFTLYAELFNMTRFRRFDELASIVGLVPLISESDETKRNKGITYRANKYLRPLIVEAAWRAVRIDPALTAAFNTYSKRMSKQKAIIRIAKKLLNRIRHVWINKTRYAIGVIE